MRTIKRRASRNAQLFRQSQRNVDRTLSVWDRIDPFQRRVLLKKMGMLRSLYKYRTVPKPEETLGRRHLEDLLLDNRLWLGTVFGFNDPFEGQADYVVHERGTDLRHALERKYRELGFTSQGAREMVNTEDVADPTRIERKEIEEHMSELQSLADLVCRLLLEKTTGRISTRCSTP